LVPDENAAVFWLAALGRLDGVACVLSYFPTWFGVKQEEEI
jgi:hypothetical protein